MEIKININNKTQFGIFHNICPPVDNQY